MFDPANHKILAAAAHKLSEIMRDTDLFELETEPKEPVLVLQQELGYYEKELQRALDKLKEGKIHMDTFFQYCLDILPKIYAYQYAIKKLK